MGTAVEVPTRFRAVHGVREGLSEKVGEHRCPTEKDGLLGVGRRRPEGRGGAESAPVDLFLRHGHLSLCACWQIARVSVLLPCLPPASPVTCSVLPLMPLRSVLRGKVPQLQQCFVPSLLPFLLLSFLLSSLPPFFLSFL